MKIIPILVLGIFLVLSIIFLQNTGLGRHHVKGCLIGSNNPSGLVCVSMATGVVQDLLPQRNTSAYSPAIDVDSTTVYYVDRPLGTLMSYRIGTEAPKQLHAWPLKPSPVVADQSSSPIAIGIHWLLLHPNNETLFFIEDHGGGKPVDLIEYSLHTGQRRVVFSRSFPTAQRPAWIDSSHLLLLLQDWSLAVLDIHSGAFNPLLDSGGYFALSYDNQYLLVNSASTPYDYSEKYDLYEFPSLRLLRSLPQEIFTKEVKSFCFADNEHVIFSMQKHHFSMPTYVLNLQSLKFRKVTGNLTNIVYLPECIIR